MKKRNTSNLVAALWLALGLMTGASAQITTTDTFGSGPNTVTIDFVNIGNAGNAPQSASNRSHSDSGGDGRGSVPYEYRISTYEISQNNITTATAAGMTNVTAGAWSGDRPAANISWYEAAAFVNWLNTSHGHQAAYDLTWSGSSWTMTLWNSANAWQLGGENLYRHKDAYYFLPSEDEWYKAAYYDPTTSSYYLYATGGDTPPTPVASGTVSSTAVYGQPVSNGPSDVNSSGGFSPYGTMGQSGNIGEWSEGAFDGTNDFSFEFRTVLGGNWADSEFLLSSSIGIGLDPSNPGNSLGFRVASIPEPSTAFLVLVAGGTCILARRYRGSNNN